METSLYFLGAWIMAGVLNYFAFLLELKIKGLKCPKTFKRSTFKLYVIFGFIGVLFSAYLLIFPKK